ncbi:hypothetical protein Tco_1195763 [Tanacetum coccineum]
MLISPLHFNQCYQNMFQGGKYFLDESVEFQDLHLNLPVLEVLAHALIYNTMLDKYVESLELGKNGSTFFQSEVSAKMEDPGLFILSCRLGDLKPFDTLADLGSKAKIAVGERITRSVFGVKGVNLGDEESPYWTMIGKKESYKPRPSSDGVGAQTPYYARKDFLDCHLLEEWKISRDDEINPFKDVLVFRRMVEFLGAIPINLKSNMWESEDLIENPINWDKPPKDGDGAWHAKIWIIDPEGAERILKTLQSFPPT